MTDESKALETFPSAMPGGEIVPYLSPKQRGALLDMVYRELGGAQGMIDWAKKNDMNRERFYSWWVKGAARPSEDTEADKNKDRIEDLLARLDAGEGATVINAVATPVVEAEIIEAGDDD